MTAATPSDAGTQQSATLLFVDDEANILTALTRLFRPLGYRILTAGGGQQGLELLASEPVDLVVSDMRMPGMDGAAFLAQVAERWPTVTRILLTGYADMASTIAAINNGHIYRYLSKPWEDNDLRLTVQQALEHFHLERERQRLEEVTRKQNEELRELNATLEARVAARTEEVRQTLGFVQVANDNLKRGYSTAIRVFANLIDMRENASRGHGQRVADLCQQLGLRMGMNPGDIVHLVHAALLHDIGRMGLPDSLLTKPFNLLTAPERNEVIKHPAQGQALLMALEPLHEAARLIRHHHERYDGQGYPDGLEADAIPLGARILAIVTDYDALQTGLLTPERKSPAQAREFIVQNRGIRYDPKITDCFVALLDSGAGPGRGKADQLLKSAAWRPGMVLARALHGRDGILILPKDTVLSENIIEKLRNLERGNAAEIGLYVAARES